MFLSQYSSCCFHRHFPVSVTFSNLTRIETFQSSAYFALFPIHITSSVFEIINASLWCRWTSPASSVNIYAMSNAEIENTTLIYNCNIFSNMFREILQVSGTILQFSLFWKLWSPYYISGAEIMNFKLSLTDLNSNNRLYFILMSNREKNWKFVIIYSKQFYFKHSSLFWRSCCVTMEFCG